MPEIKKGNFGPFGLVPEVKEVGQVHVQSYNEARTMLDVGLWAGRVAEKQAREIGKKRGLKGMPLTKFASEMSNQAANDAMEWVKKEFADWGVEQLRQGIQVK